MALVSKRNKTKHSNPEKGSSIQSHSVERHGGGLNHPAEAVSSRRLAAHSPLASYELERGRLATQFTTHSSAERYAHHSQFPDFLAGVSTRATEFSRNTPQNNLQSQLATSVPYSEDEGVFADENPLSSSLRASRFYRVARVGFRRRFQRNLLRKRMASTERFLN